MSNAATPLENATKPSANALSAAVHQSSTLLFCQLLEQHYIETDHKFSMHVNILYQ